jgi:hypothetical protein
MLEFINQEFGIGGVIVAVYSAVGLMALIAAMCSREP